MKLILTLITVLGLAACGKTVEPQDQVKTKITKFDVGGFGLVMIADFEITNNTQSPVKDIEIICNGFSETGTKIDSNTRTIYKSINPGQSIKINEFNMGYIHSSVNTTRCSTKKFG